MPMLKYWECLDLRALWRANLLQILRGKPLQPKPKLYMLLRYILLCVTHVIFVTQVYLTVCGTCYICYSGISYNV